ncbi:probable chlorophyll(ide) b reductase NYC1, chloroplastic [Beta vulgaris subsp. vulgaris]|uniref:probable chlorophyll(ide) b reductase NYC1, chloroplastic n=1 Tax=Beta vulgaris subsp. vulgaris TaxID=3555 RepID=UPI002547BFD7|nr:probable chlorophyll(ide) b reductase NYC1, chloroplastic [Beta vulgaris subsp. vulgaris]
MIGAKMVMDEHSRAGARNVVITGSSCAFVFHMVIFMIFFHMPLCYSYSLILWCSTRGLGKALGREFLLSGDRVVVTSCSVDYVNTTVKEPEENLREMEAINGKSLGYAKVIGIPSDVCDPDDVRKLADFSVIELGSVDIWVSNVLLLISINTSISHVLYHTFCMMYACGLTLYFEQVG